jgi:hypothetical protein
MSEIRYCYVCKKPIESNQSRICARIDNRAHYIHRKCDTEAPRPQDSLGSAGFTGSVAGLSCKERKQQADRIINLLDDIRDSDPDSFAKIMAAAKKAQDRQQ